MDAKSWILMGLAVALGLWALSRREKMAGPVLLGIVSMVLGALPQWAASPTFREVSRIPLYLAILWGIAIFIQNARKRRSEREA